MVRLIHSHARIVKLHFANNATDHLKLETRQPQEILLNAEIVKATLDDDTLTKFRS